MTGHYVDSGHGPSILEFILARVEEDERVAELSEAVGTRRRPAPHWQRLFNGGAQEPVMHASRLRAECEAKRRIVERATVSRERAAATGTREAEVVAAAFAIAVRIIALPYAEHPDYREEWRP